MIFRETFRSALFSLQTNKLRAFLTVLGVVIGVFSIISVMTAVKILQNSIEGGLSDLGANTFQVQKFPAVNTGGPGSRWKYRNRKDITYLQARKVLESATLAKNVGIETWQGGNVIRWRDFKTDPNVNVAGETPGGLPTNHWIVERGRGLVEQDVRLRRQICILGANVVETIFPPQIDPLGKEIIINNRTYTVVGVLEERGGMFGNSDRFVIVPLTTMFNNFGERRRSMHIMVEAPSRELFEATKDEVIGILRTARKVPPGEENDFAIFSNESIIRQFNELTYYIRIGTIAISAVALLAAGIGIMNIMLVSVTERTKEIGLRMALGALRQNILLQFISEAVVISLVGGVIGITLGILAGNAIAFFLGTAGAVAVQWIIAGVGVCCLIGVVFGTYPAWKASNLDPIEALRFE